jgi:hypothetical protein
MFLGEGVRRRVFVNFPAVPGAGFASGFCSLRCLREPVEFLRFFLKVHSATGSPGAAALSIVSV